MRGLGGVGGPLSPPSSLAPGGSTGGKADDNVNLWSGGKRELQHYDDRGGLSGFTADEGAIALHRETTQAGPTSEWCAEG